MISKDNVFSIIYHFFFALSSSVVGAILASWPLLFIFMVVQKTYETVHMSLFKVMHNYNQLMVYLVWPLKNKLKMDNFPTSPNAAEHFADCKNLFILTILVFIICLLLHFIFKSKIKKHCSIWINQRHLFYCYYQLLFFHLLLPILIVFL